MNKETAFDKKYNLILTKILVKSLMWSMVLYIAETWTINAVNKKKIEKFEMWKWQGMLEVS